MNILKKKSLCAALAGIGALGAAGAAQAVNLNPDGLGQVLIYPYYTTRTDAAGNAFNSLLSIVNSTTSVKSVKVRFIEGKNSREVFDFNLFLSGNDVWTAGVVPMGAGAGVISHDRSCILPRQLAAAGEPFVNFQYTADGADSSLDRTREGYVEIIEMATYLDSSTTHDLVTHAPPGGTPPGCDDPDLVSAAAQEVQPPTGGLFGGITLINVNSGSDYTADAVALDNFSDIAIYADAGLPQPNLIQASPPISVVFANGLVFNSFWAPSTADPVSAVLMHDRIMNEFVLDAGTRSGTDWVVTMPTKRFYVSNGTGPASGVLFQRNFNKTDGACDDIALDLFDREEQPTVVPGGFSPPNPGSGGAVCLPWEANVITFNDSNVLGSTNSSNIDTDFENGWLNINFFPSTVTAPIHTLENNLTIVTDINGNSTPDQAATYFGLPVIGFAVQSFANGAVMVNGVNTLSNYGGNFVQKGTRFIDSLLPVPLTARSSRR